MDLVDEHEQDPSAYGARLADDYDELYGDVFDTEAAIDQLVALAEGGRVLEMGVGTGRIALPLAARALEVWGVDGSPAMLERLAAKPAGSSVRAVCGDFGTIRVGDNGEQFDLVLLLVNTIYAMPSQEHQIACFANVARHLRPGGRFVVEAWVPDPPRGGEGLGLRARRLGEGYAGLVFEEHDASRQVLSTRQVVISATGQTKSFPVVHRYAWPAEMDLMARMSDMSLESRWGDWHRRPFDAASINHISVWRRD